MEDRIIASNSNMDQS